MDQVAKIFREGGLLRRVVFDQAQSVSNLDVRVQCCRGNPDPLIQKLLRGKPSRLKDRNRRCFNSLVSTSTVVPQIDSIPTDSGANSRAPRKDPPSQPCQFALASALGQRTKRLAPGRNSLNICNNLGSSGVGSVAFEKAGARRVTLRAGPARAHHRLTGGVGSRSKRPPPLNAFKPEIFFSPRA